ncbi:bacillopeptidase F [Geomicrobium sp. JCM 19037]|uniref:S8 family serine peptidase n=1 Tax=Geomicrobium sp. JCM 19037 TaxID=1460634 RepID=UPI00045F4596|nr:S8 family serine peptidase [Geomicrobium sp. JCM 19037]GAK03084.1 bacillopeptidase F [Geomicrobium sp. JCM 19037]
MGKKVTYRRNVAVMMIGALVMSPYAGVFGSGTAQASERSNVTDLQRENAERANEKIDDEVAQAFRNNDHVSVLIEMSDQVDTSAAAQQGLQTVGSDATPHQQRRAMSNSVYNELRSTAIDTQATPLAMLEQAEADGKVLEYESLYIMNVIAAEVDRDTARALSFRPEISRIKMDEFIELDLPEMSPENMELADDSVEWNIDRVNAPDVWDDLGITGEGVTVGIIDSGTDWTHEALQQNWRGYNPDDPENSDSYGNWFDAVEGQDMPYDLASQPHGTHVMGTILGQDPDGDNKIGVAPDTEWISARAFSALGGTESDLLASGQYMLAPEDDPSLAPDIVNNSWGGQPGVDDWYRPMVQAWQDSGIVGVFSAGNSGPGSETVTPPANYPESYAVAAVDINDAVASFSSRGPSQYEDDLKPNISAPGVNIRSSVPGGYEAGWNGTSMAAPHIAGAAALLLSVDSGLSPNEVYDILDETAEPLTDSQYTTVPNDAYGLGMLNAYEAVASISGDLGTLEGQVLQEGSDDLPPEIEHSPVDSVFAGYDVPVTATISDDVSVIDAEVWMTNDNINHYYVFSMEQVAGDHEEGTYRALLPANLIDEDGFEYYIQARDYGRNVAQTDTYNVDVDFGVVPGEYSEDFSSEPVGWTFEGDWAWGEPESGPEPVSGDNLVGTNLSGNYSDDTHVLYSVPLDLRDSDTASLRTNHWYDVVGGVDYANVLVSDDYGDSWDIVQEFTGTSDGWDSLYVDLDEYAGSSEPVLVSFVLESNSSTTAEGWYLDNVNLMGEDTTAPNAPENLDVQSSTAGLQLSWDAPADEDLDLNNYSVYRSVGDGFDEIGNATSTTFQDMDVEGGTEYTYAVTANDYDGNESETSNEATAIAPNISVFYHSNFQDDDGEFESGGTNSSWEWGEPTSGPNGALTGDNVWATSLSGNYNNAEDSYIGSPVLDLSDVELAELHFNYWQDIENNWDYGLVQVSSDGGDTWDEIAEFTGRDQEWAQAEISLNDYLGESIQLRFAFDSDSIITYAGWYIDDVTVVGTSESVDHVAENEDVASSVQMWNALNVISMRSRAFQHQMERLTMKNLTFVKKRTPSVQPSPVSRLMRT